MVVLGCRSLVLVIIIIIIIIIIDAVTRQSDKRGGAVCSC